VIGRSAPRPVPTTGQNAKTFAARAIAYGDENAAVIDQGRANYGEIITRFGTGQ
jgi:hypothetical protein